MIRGGLRRPVRHARGDGLDPATHEVTVVNAGHMSPEAVPRRDRRTGRRDLAGRDRPAARRAAGLRVRGGDDHAGRRATSVALFTDGVTDAMNPAGEHVRSGRGGPAPRPGRRRLTGRRPAAQAGRRAAGRRRSARTPTAAPQNDDIAVVASAGWNAGGPTTGANKAPQPAQQGWCLVFGVSCRGR